MYQSNKKIYACQNNAGMLIKMVSSVCSTAHERSQVVLAMKHSRFLQWEKLWNKILTVRMAWKCVSLCCSGTDTL